MFTSNFVLEDWALHELLPNPRQRRVGIILVASSYVTWTWQNHTFSNSIETLILLWCLVLVQRIRDDDDSPRLTACAMLSFLAVLGMFNRITFPAFLVIPLLLALPHFYEHPLSFFIATFSALSTLMLAVAVDTEWYTAGNVNLSNFHRLAVFTPWNNLVYNFDASNLASHGTHPYYQHFGVNLPQLLGPATILLGWNWRNSMRLYSALFGTFVLSCFSHQEARFLLPAVPLILSSVDVPQGFSKTFFAVWLVFNLVLGLLMGIYHQGGIVPTQLWISQQSDITQAFWWKTQMSPSYLLGTHAVDVEIHDLMGRPAPNMTADIIENVSCDSAPSSVLVAPQSAIYLDQFALERSASREQPFTLERIFTHKNHLNLDDLDPGEEGLRGTLSRVVGRRGLDVWRIHRSC